MGWMLMASIGALFAGLFLGLRELVPYVAARRSGVITRKGARAIRVQRDEDPDSFDRLLANRSKGAASGFGLSMLGLIGVSLFVLAIAGVTGPLATVVFLFYIGLAIFAVYCLIRGFATGRMFAFWGFTLFGEATLKQNPAWFWAYAILNFVIVLAGVGNLWSML